MNPPPDDRHEFEPPMTRAHQETDADDSLRARPGDAEGTQDDLTKRQPRTDVPGVAPPSSFGSSPGSSTAGSSARGVVGKIEPKQVLYSKYQVLKKLGGGAMGDVWLVHHLVLKNLHALKLIVPNIATNDVALMRFRREFEVMASLNHPHAVRIYDASIDEAGGFIDMEYVEGRTLHDLLVEARHRPDLDPSRPLMPLPWIVRILDQLTDVLQEAHEKGIVHRDLKPSNLMLLDGKKPGKEALKVLDFGIAKIRDDPESAANMTLTQGFIGTPSYGSPEQALNRQDIDGRADLYSVGVMLYEFVTGRLPFKGVHFQVMHQHAAVPPPPFHEANPRLRPLPELEHAILRALAKDRDHRPQTARDLFDEFERAVIDLLGPDALRPPPPSSEAVRIPRPAPPPADLATERDDGQDLAWAPVGPDTHPIPPSAPGLGKPPPGPPSTLGPAVESSRPRRGLLLGLLGLAALAVLAFGIVALVRPRPVIVPPRRDTPPARAPRLPDGFVAVAGYEVPGDYPTKIRRGDEARFDLFAPGIYLPSGYSAVDKDDLVDGWPRLIRRDDDPTGALFVRILGDKEWTMGAWDVAPDAQRPDAPAHPVLLRSGFYIQKTELTNGQVEEYLRLAGRARPPEWFEVFSRRLEESSELARKHPAVNLRRKFVVELARSVTAMLATEAQWEYAARSGGDQRRFVRKLKGFPSRQVANIERVDGQTTAPVGSFDDDATEDGVLDMTGNVKEVCRDVWKAYRKSPGVTYDPFEDGSDSTLPDYVVRGGDFNAIPDECTTTYRVDRRPEAEFRENLGYRLVVECPDARRAR